MPRIRNIKPEFFTSESVAELPLRTRLTWIGLWTHCDNYGRARDNAKLVKAAVWPLDEVTLAEVAQDLTTLAEHGRIVRYEVAERHYLAITNWEEHQYGAGKGTPQCPPPDESESRSRTARKRLNPDQIRLNTSSPDSNDTRPARAAALVEKSPPSTENVALPGNSQPSTSSVDMSRSSAETFSPIQVSRDKDQGSRHVSPPPIAARQAQFDEFWNAYPRKKAKQDARQAWDGALDSGADPNVLIAAAGRYGQQRAGQNPKYTKHPATWLRAECWNDEPDEPPLRLVSGGHQPFTNPTDDAVYEEGLL